MGLYSLLYFTANSTVITAYTTVITAHIRVKHIGSYNANWITAHWTEYQRDKNHEVLKTHNTTESFYCIKQPRVIKNNYFTAVSNITG